MNNFFRIVIIEIFQIIIGEIENHSQTAIFPFPFPSIGSETIFPPML